MWSQKVDIDLPRSRVKMFPERILSEEETVIGRDV